VPTDDASANALAVIRRIDRVGARVVTAIVRA
jgi:hypothetical protein